MKIRYLWMVLTVVGGMLVTGCEKDDDNKSSDEATNTTASVPHGHGDDWDSAAFATNVPQLLSGEVRRGAYLPHSSCWDATTYIRCAGIVGAVSFTFVVGVDALGGQGGTTHVVTDDLPLPTASWGGMWCSAGSWSYTGFSFTVYATDKNGINTLTATGSTAAVY